MSLLPLLALSAHGATLAVPADFPNIERAIANASAGDVIEVAAGSYRETVSIDIDLTVRGTAGSASTTWRNSGFDDVLTIDGGAIVVIEGFTFEPSLLGRAVDVTSGDATLSDILVEGNTVTDRPGGALRVRTGASLTVEDSRLVNNDASGFQGGHIHADGATLTLRRTLLDSGSADEGGAIFAEGTRVTLEDCELLGNEAGNGGGLSLIASTLNATGTRFADNRATSSWSDPNGGAGLFREASIVTLDDVIAEDNVTDSRGGAFDFGDAAVVVTGGSYTGNQAGFGGAFYLDGGQLTVDASTFRANAATDGSGGAIRFRASGGSLSLTGSLLTENTATDSGGAVAILTLSGAALPAVTVEESRFDANVATGDGGALSLNDVDGRFVGNQFCHNEASAGAGAFAVASAGLWTNNVFQSNLADGAGGGMRLQDDADADVVNNTFVANRATDGGALSASNAAVRFVNNAVAYHPEGGGVSTEATVGVLTYSLFWDNLPADLSPNLSTVVGPDVLFTAPGFTSWSDDNDCLNDELWPAVGSALINNGDPTISDPLGGVSDIGAYGGPDAEPLPGEDGDGDGYGAGVDCDDTDASVNPGAVEDCTLVDRDCSGDPLDATSGDTFYADADSDGYGTTTDTVTGCGAPEGYVDNSDDCQDNDPEVFPGAPERCNSVDDDCDGAVDEDVASTWWVDADGDGWGTGTALNQCDPPPGYAPQDGDCDDTAADVYPGADDDEGDGIDANCDGADGTASTTGPVPDEGIKASGNCGCQAAPSSGLVAGAPLLLVGLLRRRRADRAR